MSVWTVRVEGRDEDHHYLENEYELEADNQDDAEDMALERFLYEHPDAEDLYVAFCGEV